MFATDGIHGRAIIVGSIYAPSVYSFTPVLSAVCIEMCRLGEAVFFVEYCFTLISAVRASAIAHCASHARHVPCGQREKINIATACNIHD